MNTENLSESEFKLHHSLSSKGYISGDAFGLVSGKFCNDYEQEVLEFINNSNTSISDLKEIFGIGELDYALERFINFDYQHNFHGFRDHNFQDFVFDNTENEIWCFGCSFTYGVGVPAEYTWPALIQQKTGLTTKNFGVKGASPYTAYRLLSNWLKYVKHKPSAVYMYGWFPGRVEHFDESSLEIHHLSSQNIEEFNVYGKTKIYQEFLDKIDHEPMVEKINNLLNSENIDHFTITDIQEHSWKCYGRDLRDVEQYFSQKHLPSVSHPGIIHQNLIAHHFINRTKPE